MTAELHCAVLEPLTVTSRTPTYASAAPGKPDAGRPAGQTPTIGVDALVDAIWDQDLPARPTPTLQVHMSKPPAPPQRRLPHDPDPATRLHLLAAGLRALIAAGLVDVHDGDLRTHGPATLVRGSRAERRRVLAWTPAPGSPHPALVWIVLTERLLLQHRETFPGVYQFMLGEVRRAATRLASELAFDAQIDPARPIAWTDDDDAGTSVRETLALFPVASEFLVLDSGPFVGNNARASPVLHKMTLRSALSEDRGPVWGIRQDRDTTPVVARWTEDH